MSTIDEINKQIEKVAKKIEKVAEEIEKVAEEIGKVAKKIDEVENNIKDLENDSATKTNNYAVWEKRLKKLQDKKKELEDEKKELKTEKNNLQTKENQLQAEKLLLLQRQSAATNIKLPVELYASSTPVTSLEKKESSSLSRGKNIVFQINNISPTKYKQLLELLTKTDTETATNQSKTDLATRLANVEFSSRLKLLTELHFHRKYGSCTIDFQEKRSGIQSGTIAHISANGELITTYYVKTHQGGVKFGRNASSRVDPRELIVYKWLELMGYGASIDFFYNDYDVAEFFIASKSLGPHFKTFEDLTKDNDKQEFYQRFCAVPDYRKGLIAMDLICKMFFIRDVANNADNFGFVSNLTCHKLAIIDFKINPDLFDEDMVAAFKKSNISLSTKQEKHKKYFDNIDQESKIQMASEIFSDLNLNMVSRLEDAEKSIKNLLETNEEQMPLKTSDEKFYRSQKYVEQVKANVNKFQSLFDSISSHIKKN